MNLSKHFWTACLFCLVFCNAVGQITSLLPELSAENFDLPDKAVIDSSVHAVMLVERGTSDLQVDEFARELRVLHRYAARILILDQQGFDQANRQIVLYKIGNDFEKVNWVKARTHYLDQGIQTKEMEENAVFLEKASELVNLSKFTLPDIREHCIIDIEYELSSPDIFNYRSWLFQQEDVPKLYSEYTAIIPSIYNYNVTLKGFQELTNVKTDILRDHFLINGRRFDCSKLTYVMDNIPAFQTEPYMLAPKNYKSAINFELVDYYMSNGAHTNLTKNWKDVDRELLTDNKFGREMKRDRLFDDIFSQLYSLEATQGEKARRIFDYIKAQIKWNKVYGIYAQYGVKDALERRTGNIDDINLALIAALNAAGIDAYPVLLSTRENGLPNDLHPVISDFNYLVARVELDGGQYFLDASEDNIPFGLLPLRCINGNGRIIYSRKSSEWIKLENTIDASTQYNISGSMDKDGQFSGIMSISYKGLDALNQRNYIKSFSSLDEFVEERMNHSLAIEIEDGQVHQLDSLEEILKESYTIKIDFSDHIRGDEFLLNPILIGRMTRNPFNLEDRNFEVDLGSKRQQTYLISIQMPESFAVERGVDNLAIALPDATARYAYRSQFENGLFIMKEDLGLNKAIYSPEEYFHLKEFYSRIIQQQAVDFGFKLQ